MMRYKVQTLLFLFFLGNFSKVSSQSVYDIVKYSTTELNGSARYQALGGAFGALGGDLSSISNNPAGSTIFNYNEGSATIGVNVFSNDVNFLNGANINDKTSFDINQFGFVLGFVNKKEKWDKVAVGFNFQSQNNFNNKIEAQAVNMNRGLVDYFVNLADRFEFNVFDLENNSDNEYSYLGSNLGYDAQHAYLGLATRLIEYDSESSDYIFYDSIEQGIDQLYNSNTSGFQHLYSINFSAQYSQKLSLGVNINIVAIEFHERKATSDLYLDTQNSFLKQVDFIQDFSVFGSGVSFQGGALYRPINSIRLGFTYSSPTFLEFDEEYTEGLDVRYYEELDGSTGSSLYPSVVNILSPYKLKTPSISQFSLAFVGKNGLISFDYGNKNYSATKISGGNTSNTYNYLNQEIDNKFIESSTFLRAGTELKLNYVSLRGGYWNEGSPFKNSLLQKNIKGYSFGLGINFGGTSLDLAYLRGTKEYSYPLYEVGLTDMIEVKKNTDKISLTYIVRF